MDKFIINGPTKLNGEVKISGSKNAALPILTACLSFPGTYKLKNIPDLKDTRTMMNLLVYCDGNMDLVDIAELIDQPVWELVDLASKLESKDILKKVSK